MTVKLALEGWSERFLGMTIHEALPLVGSFIGW